MNARKGHRWWNYRPGQLGKNAIYGAAGLGVRAVVQAAYLLIVSRWLGAEGYGLFAGSGALFILCAPIASWGSLLLLTRYVTRDRGVSRSVWATALGQTLLLGGLLLLGLLVVSLFLPHRLPLWPMLMLGISELILLPVTWAAASQCHALEHGKGAAVAVCLGPVGRVGFMLLSMTVGFLATPANAAIAHFAGSVAAAFAAMLLVARVDGWPQWHSRLRLRVSLREGAPYAASNVASVGYQEADKFLMLQILGAVVAGPYTVAFRVASIFVIPITALLTASLPRLMIRAGTSDSTKTFRAMLASGVGYGVLAGVAILAFAPWVPRIFGPEYALASHYLVLLTVWPAMFAVRHSLATYLTAQHQQAIRSWIEIAGLVILLVMNLLLLPRLGAGAAVLSLLTAEVLAALAMGISIGRISRTNMEQAD